MAPAPIPTAKPIMKPILTLSKQLGCACPYGPTATGIFLLWTDLNKNTHAFHHKLMLFVCDQNGLFYLLIWLAYYIVYLHDKLGLGAGMVFQENGMFQDRDSCTFTGKVWGFLILALFPPSRSKYLLGTKKKKKNPIEIGQVLSLNATTTKQLCVILQGSYPHQSEPQRQTLTMA